MLRKIRFILLFFLLSCKPSRPEVILQFTNPDGSLSPKLSAEIAHTISLRKLGLMYRTEMEPTHGMLFVFPDNEVRNFWMKNTHISLDIIYLGSDLSVVSIIEKAEPFTETQLPSGKPAKYALEVLAGQAATWKVMPSSKLRMEGELPTAE
jgi:uncharacterized membrane protein (UPF0127 family)